ncbi:MAG: phosphoenolpyruvate-utilizing N-terminal domain-containing protein [Ruthenibacterium sp.]
MRYVSGISASFGRIVGPMRRVCHTQSRIERVVNTPYCELVRMTAAEKQAGEELLRMEEKAPKSGKEIFMVQRMMLADAGLNEEIRRGIEAGVGAAAAVERAGNLYAQCLRAISDSYLSQRACDVMDVCQRVIDILDGNSHKKCKLTQPSILVADEIYPTDLVTPAREMVLGFVSSMGSPCAHAAILARHYGIPAVVQAGADFMQDCDGKMAAIDGASGEIYLTPDAATRARFAQAM